LYPVNCEIIYNVVALQFSPFHQLTSSTTVLHLNTQFVRHVGRCDQCSKKRNQVCGPHRAAAAAVAAAAESEKRGRPPLGITVARYCAWKCTRVIQISAVTHNYLYQKCRVFSVFWITTTTGSTAKQVRMTLWIT
jgi:hypothetical protein